MSSLLSSALRMKDAIDSIPKMTSHIFETSYELENEEEEEEEEEEESEEEEENSSHKPKKFKSDKFELTPTEYSHRQKHFQTAWRDFSQRYLAQSVSIFAATSICDNQRDANFFGSNSIHISYPECEGDLKFVRSWQDNLCFVEQLWSKAQISPFGDVKTQETRIDQHTVRNAREIPLNALTLPTGLSSFVQHQWETSSLAPRQVRAEPYKLIIYGPGGFFKLHQDTPEKELVGTALLRLCDTSDGKLVVYPPPYLQVQQPFEWGSRGDSLCMFYPDLSHELTTISYGYRVLLAFKIFFDDSQPTYTDAQMKRYQQENPSLSQLDVLAKHDFWEMTPTQEEKKEKEAKETESKREEFLAQREKAIFEEFDQQFVSTLRHTSWLVLLDHEYSNECSPELLKGVDSAYYHLISSLRQSKEYSFSLEIVSILITHAKSATCGDYDDSDDFNRWKIYPITDDLLQGQPCANPFQLQTQPVVVNVDSLAQGYTWSHHHEFGAEFTGNESRPEDTNSVYISKAILCRPK